MTTKSGSQVRVAYCDCGAGLAGASGKELFEAAKLHVARAHPQLLLGSESLLTGAPTDFGPAA
jgi:hypothetical protein